MVQRTVKNVHFVYYEFKNENQSSLEFKFPSNFMQLVNETETGLSNSKTKIVDSTIQFFSNAFNMYIHYKTTKCHTMIANLAALFFQVKLSKKIQELLPSKFY